MSCCVLYFLYNNRTLIFFAGVFFFFKQKTAYEMRISDWSSDVCSSDLRNRRLSGIRRSLREQLFGPFARSQCKRKPLLPALSRRTREERHSCRRCPCRIRARKPAVHRG